MGTDDCADRVAPRAGVLAAVACEVDADESWFATAAQAAVATDPGGASHQALGAARLSLEPETVRRSPHRRSATSTPATVTRTSGASGRPRGLVRFAAAGTILLALVVVVALLANPPRTRVVANSRSAATLHASAPQAQSARAPRQPATNAAGLLLSPITAAPATSPGHSPPAQHGRRVAPRHRVRAGGLARLAASPRPASATPPPGVATTTSAPRPAPARVDSTPPPARPVYRAPARRAQPSFTPGDLAPSQSTP